MNKFFTLMLSFILMSSPIQSHKILFCHGIISNENQLNLYPSQLLPFSSSFNFEDAQATKGYNVNNIIFKICNLFNKPVNRAYMHMGYGNDIQTLQSNINPKEQTILYGLSRGGSTIINYLAQHNPSNITGMILEATPCDVVNAVQSIQYATGIPFAPTRFLQEIVFKSAFPSYKLKTNATIDRIQNIKNKELPILIIHSQDDTRVHISSSWKLYAKFKNLGFKKVYLCELTTGKHGFYTQGPCQHNMHNAIQLFIEATKSSDFTTMPTSLSPNMQKIKLKLTKYQQETITQYTRKKIRNCIILLTAISLYFYAHSSR